MCSTGQLAASVVNFKSMNPGQQRNVCLKLVEKYTNKLKRIALQDCPEDIGLNKAGLHARVAPVTLLRNLINQNMSLLSGGNYYIGALAVVIAHLKRLNRIIFYANNRSKYSVELARELETQECENWNPLDNPEWLLLELELDITIRPIQVKVARRMMKMPNLKNGVMQLNMGEGKTSVIIPMIVATLSRSEDLLCRVTVLNSIYTTNYNLLAFTIGGFLNKRLYTVPCCRDIEIGGYLDQIQNIYSECVRLGGAVITLPEYRLSFRLQMYNSFLLDRNAVGLKIYQIESWLRKHARDLVDESDEIFSVKYQLIYTTGKQLQMDGGNMRWTVCQKLLEYVPQVAAMLLLKYGTKVVEFQWKKAVECPEKFTHLRILGDECKAEFCELMADGILDGKVNLIGRAFRDEERKIIKEFLTNENISEEDHLKLDEVEGISTEKRLVLLLVSGYLRRGILFAALKKRWRVESGVKKPKPGTTSKLMAVPFRAKDVAAERTEFGHPDMAIVLTQLSYYYSGLSDGQLRQCFHILDTAITGPDAVYNSWIRKVPSGKITSDTVKSYKAINIQDYEQRTVHLFPLLRTHKAVVDFWLENVAFPKECKQFPCKLVTNHCDLCYERNAHPTTGFSGTNDTCLLLPAQITQQDLKVLFKTNEKMEETLKRKENRWERSLTVGDGCKAVLRFMIQDGLRVLIDAGALMLELGNEEIADLWLELDKTLEAVVYFNKSGEMVIKVRRNVAFRKQAKREQDQPFTLSPFKDRLEKCGIYLDDQHTRGTDIKLPTNFKACVTIGSGMRRDKLIQACMRMRKLGKGQSVHFYLSHEVHNKITSQMEQQTSITVKDIIDWTKSISYQFEKDGLVYWATNARNYAKNLAADDVFEASSKSPEDGKVLAERCEDPDAQELQVMYGTYHHQCLVTKLVPKWFAGIPNKLAASGPLCDEMTDEVNGMLDVIKTAVLEKCQEHIPEKIFYHSMLEEEQEKELEPEQEVEEEKYRPPEETPLTPSLHPNVLQCVTRMKSASVMDGISRLSDIFRDTTIRNKIEAGGWGSTCFVTEDFIQVIQTSYTKRGNDMDCFLRSIRYFVSFKNGLSATTALILSLYEVNHLISYLRERRCLPGTTLHMFSGRWMEGQPIFANDPRLQLPFRSGGEVEGIFLDENVMAPLLIAAGNLYFSSMEEQRAFARFLGLRLRPWTEEEETAFQEKRILSSGFVLPRSPELRGACNFCQDPTDMVIAILKIRNDVLRDSDHTVLMLETCAYILSNEDEEMPSDPSDIED